MFAPPELFWTPMGIPLLRFHPLPVAAVGGLSCMDNIAAGQASWPVLQECLHPHILSFMDERLLNEQQFHDLQAAQRRQAMDGRETDVAREPQRPDVVGEQAVEQVGRRHHGKIVGSAPARVALQRVGGADVEAEPLCGPAGIKRFAGDPFSVPNGTWHTSIACCQKLGQLGLISVSCTDLQSDSNQIIQLLVLKFWVLICAAQGDLLW